MYKTCRRLTRWLPVILVLILLSWSYYTFVIILCLQELNNYIEQILCLTIFHIILVMVIWTYYQLIFTPPPKVPEKFKLPSREVDRLKDYEMDDRQNAILEDFSRNLQLRNRSDYGGIRYCKQCNQLKPDRAHHCSTCEKCILKMDHHCEWTNNCVCFSNYKYFILFVGYILIYCLFISVTTFSYFISSLHPNYKRQTIMYIVCLCLLTTACFIALLPLFFYHIHLISANKTLLEAIGPPVFIGGPAKYTYNLGKRKNFRQVFGRSLIKCFLPVFTSVGNGVDFPIMRTSGTSLASESERWIV